MVRCAQNCDGAKQNAKANKSKGQLVTGHEWREGEKRYLTSTLDKGGGVHTPPALPLRNKFFLPIV